jgi:hypothetical protein
VENNDSKPWYLSKGVIGGAVAVVASIAGLFNYSIAPDDQAQLVELIIGITTLVGGGVAIVGRITASKKIG